MEALQNLSQIEEIEYIKEAKRGNEKAKDILIRSNLRTIYDMAKKLPCNNVITFEDLVQEGCLGICIAIEKFDVSKNVRFTTYANYWIKKAIHDSMSKNNSVKVSNLTYFNALKMVKIKNSLEEKLHREPSLQEIAEESGLSKKKVRNYLDIVCSPISLDNLEETYGEYSENSDNDEVFNSCFLGFEKAHIKKAFQHLEPREQEILSMRFGLNGEPMTLENIRHQYGVSRERVRQIEKKALKKLASPQLAEQLKVYL